MYLLTGKVCRECSSAGPAVESRGAHITLEAATMDTSNEQAKDSRVTFADGSTRLLSEMWHEQPLVLVFLRHLG